MPSYIPSVLCDANPKKFSRNFSFEFLRRFVFLYQYGNFKIRDKVFIFHVARFLILHKILRKGIGSIVFSFCFVEMKFW